MLFQDGASSHGCAPETRGLWPRFRKYATGRRRLLPLLFATVLSGCAALQTEQADQATMVVPTAAAAPQDPLATFAAAATPGSETVLTIPGTGRTERVRLQRAYFAASGRECRELLIGSGMMERSTLICQDETGWSPARPLLKGSGRMRR